MSARAGAPESLLRRGRRLLVYIHGGYWQQLSAAESLFNAADARRHGVSLAAVEYSLAPKATIEQIIEECVEQVRAIVDEWSPSRVVLAGCSAGAHLVAWCLRDPSVRDRVDAAVFLSGIFDLRPLVSTSINEPLHLDDERARRLSPMFFTGPHFVPSLVAVGGHEPPAFIKQSRDFARVVGCAPARVIGHRDHFDLPYDLLADGTEVGDWVLARLHGE